LRELEARIEAYPADAIAHLMWPCYRSPPPVLSFPSDRSLSRRRGSTRKPATSGAPARHKLPAADDSHT
jgi:hypothetical protein